MSREMKFRIFKKIGIWLLQISGKRSLKAMSSQVKHLAAWKGEQYSRVSIDLTAIRDDVYKIEYTVYIHGYSSFCGETFNEAFAQLKEAVKQSKKKVVIKDVLV